MCEFYLVLELLTQTVLDGVSEKKNNYSLLFNIVFDKY
jgi:hypothetical protein